MICTHKEIKLDIGNGRIRKDGFITIDITQYIDGNNDECVDIVRDIEKYGLPFCDNSINEIHADNVLEHMSDIIFVMNEMHRVLKPDGRLKANVPVAGSEPHYQDPTHKSNWIPKTLEYFTGVGGAKPERPSHPRYADYHILPWKKISVKVENENDLQFELEPRKI